ncbi:LPD38 domain-containing protein [Pyramidobacter sp.]|uniref:LPD38 domain-containing protein n=1 Tax=Pyramidobacter sp. TaxID=1943581 RepID=UPI00332955B3
MRSSESAFLPQSDTQTIPQSSNGSNRDFSVHGSLPQVTVTASLESKSAGTLIRIKDIYDKLRAIAPVRKGVSAPANVAGYYTPETDVARERHWGDFSTALHEIGHALDYKLGLRENVRDAETSRQLYDELCELGKATSPQSVNTIYEKLHGRYMRASGEEARGPDVSAAALKFEEAQRYLMKEGIAEYFRAYAYNPDLMEVVAPEYTKLFREALEAHEEYQQPVSELFDAVRSYSELTPEQKLRAGMIRGDEKVRTQKGWRASAAEAWNGFRQKFDDQLRYLEQMQNLLRDRVRELAKERGGRYADMLQHGELKDEFAVYDMLRTMPGYMGKAKRDVLALMEPVKKLGDEAYAKLTSYMKAMRALDYWDNGLEPGIGLTRAEVSAVVNRTRHENPELARIAEDIAKAYEAMVERTLIDSGVWSRGQYEEYKKRWPHYVPFVRVNEDGSVTSPTRRGKGIVNLSNQVKQATGVGAADAVIDTKDPFEMMVKNALVFNQLAEKNRAAQALVRAALADPALFADVIEPVQGGERSGDTFTVWFDGTRRAFTGDKKLIDALAAMEQAAGIRNPIFGSLDRAAQGAANLLKLGATRANPAFILTNFIRDAMYSSLTNSAEGVRSMPFFGTVKGLLMQTAKDETAKQRIADALDHGLAYSGITELGLNASEKGISKYVGRAIHGDRGFLRKFKSWWNNTIGAFNEMIELAPKFAEYDRLVKEGYPKRYAARMAREVNLDFARGGQWGKVWNRYTAFFNPAVQGTSKLVRTAAAHPGRFAARTAMYVILPSLISWMAGRDDDEYKRISRNIKDRYWVFKVGGTWLRLPKPELAGLFGSAVERVLDAAFEHDPMAFRELGRSVWEGFSPNLLPTFAEPILEHRMGKTFFYDSPLIPPQLENLPPELQFTKNTSSMAKFLGKAWGVSPILIDHYVSSYGGGVGEYLSKAPDIFLKPQEEAKKLSEKPLFSRFTVDPNRNSESLAKFYDLRKQATVAKNAYDVRRKMGEQPEYSAGVHMAKAFDQSARKLSDWRKDIAAIQQSKSMTPERKREVIDRIRLRMNQEAEAAVRNYFTVKEKLNRRER